jgi:hypothetical protein
MRYTGEITLCDLVHAIPYACHQGGREGCYIRGYLTASNSSDIFSKERKDFFKKGPAEEVFVMNPPEEKPIGRILPEQ